jgi:hypothetical protein
MGINRRIAAAVLVALFPLSLSATPVAVTVPKKSVQDLLNAASPVLNENPLGYVQAYDSPFQYQQRPYSAPVKQSIKIPTPAIKEALKGTLKTNAAAVAMHAAMAGAVAAVGWVIDEAGQPVKKVASDPIQGSGPNDYYWQQSGRPKTGSASQSCNEFATWMNSNLYEYKVASVSVTGSSSRCVLDRTEKSTGNTQSSIQTITPSRYGSTCPSGANYDNVTGACVKYGYAPVSDPDYDLFDSYVGSATPDLKSKLANEACKASLSPQRCYQSLQDAASFLNSGPSSIKGPSSSSVTTKKNADGTTSTTTTNTQTNFDMNYSSDGFTANPNKVTTTTNPDGSTTETVEKEQDNSTTVQKPGDPEEEGDDPLDKEYTFTDPKMPEVPSFYEQKYPKGLQSVWDDNKARFDNSAFISFMKSFVPSFSGSCPTWGLAMNILPQASYGYFNFASICYVFDFVKVVIIATAVFTARKIMFGG